MDVATADFISKEFWPLTVLLCVIAFFMFFRENIRRFIDDIKSVKKDHGKVEVETTRAQINAQIQSEKHPLELGLQNDGALSSEQEKRRDDVLNAGIPEILKDRTARIRVELQSLNLHGEDAIKLLTEHLAIMTLSYCAEYIYRIIFGSQISIMKHLNCFGAIDETTFNGCYEHTKQQYPQVYLTYTYEQYKGFLLANNLVVYVNQEYRITMEGRAFLKWMVENGLSENKLF